jgi:hypothetical protein
MGTRCEELRCTFYFKSYDLFYQERYGKGTNHYHNKMAVPLGRFTINANGQTIYSLTVHSDVSHEFEFVGKTTWDKDVVANVGFHAVGILKYGSQLYKTELNQESLTL